MRYGDIEHNISGSATAMHPAIIRLRGLIFKPVLLAVLLSAVPVAWAATPQPVTIPALAPWIGTSGKPTAATWRHAARFAVDNEIQPGHNRPAPVVTEAYVGYTKTTLWLHFVAHDPRPQNVQVKYRRHDVFTNSGEYVGIIFSPFNDTQSGYEFFCSAAGTELDAFRQHNNEYDSFDTIWYCHAHRTASGYAVTMQIPFDSLKFPHSGRPQTWRLLLFRNWARSVRHQITQVKLNFNSNCTLCDAQLVRTATPIRAHGKGLLIIPQVTVSRTDQRKTPASGLENSSRGVSGGLDLRWAIRPDLALAAALNPNFSQVAPDVLQPTVNRRFAIFYPENRPFFRRGTWVFNSPSFAFGLTNQDDELVDTRQIADPHYAAKVVGQVGSNALGALVADDSYTNILLPGRQSSTFKSFGFPTRDALLRYRYDFAGNSDLGVLATSRHGGGYSNDLVATDGIWQLDPSDSVVFQAARSTTTYPDQVASAFGIAPGTVTGNGWAVSFQRIRHNYTASIAAGRVSSGFRADSGYLPRVGYTEIYPTYEYDWYSHHSWWNKFGVGGSYDRLDATGGGPILDRQTQLYAYVHAVGQSDIALDAYHEDQYVSGKTFALNRLELDASAQPLPWLGFELDTVGGDGVDYAGVRKGGLLSIAPSFTLMPGSHLKIAFVGNFERLNVAGGRLYTADLYDLRVAWYFNSRMFVRAIAQDQDIRNNVALYPPGTPSRTRSLATQFLFGYVLNPYTSLYAGFSNGYIGTGNAGIVQTGRTYFLKLSYAFQF
jgi:hypothetical protein